MESTRVDLISLHSSNVPNLVLALQNRQYGDLPIPPDARLLSCQEAFQTDDNLSWTAFKLLLVKSRVADIAVKVERTKLVAENLVDGEKVDMLVLGLYSANVARLGVVEGDLMLVAGATVMKTRIQPKQVDPSAWTVYVGQELFKKKEPSCKVRFVRLGDVLDETNDGELDLTEENMDQNEVLRHQTPETCVEFMEVDDNSRIANPIASGSKDTNISEVVASDNVASQVIVPAKSPVTVASKVTVPASNAVTVSDYFASKVTPNKVKSPRIKVPKVVNLPPAKMYNYTELKQCTKHKSRYNTWAVIKEVVELPTRRKTKLVARLLITDESLESWGDLSETYRFSILAGSMENIPPLSTGSVLRIHHMMAEIFNGTSDGRVYDGRSVVVVEGTVGEDIKPISTKDDLGELVWSRSDEERVKQLRKFYVESFIYDLKLEQIDKELLFNLNCVVTKVIEVPDAIVLRVADGTEAKLFSLSWKNEDSQEAPDENVTFVDVHVTHSELMDLVQKGRVNVGSYIRMAGLRCKLHKKLDSQGMSMEFLNTQGMGVDGFEFVFENSERRSVGVEVLHNGDSRVEAIRERMGEKDASMDVDEGRDALNKTDMDIDALIAAVNTNGTFSLPPSPDFTKKKSSPEEIIPGLSQTLNSSDFTKKKSSPEEIIPGLSQTLNSSDFTKRKSSPEEILPVLSQTLSSSEFAKRKSSPEEIIPILSQTLSSSEFAKRKSSPEEIIPILSQTLSSSEFAKKRSSSRQSSQDSLELALGTSASPPHTPKSSVSGLVTPVVPISPTPSIQDPDSLPNSQQSDELFVSATSSFIMSQLISKQESTNVPKCQETSPEPLFATANWVAESKNTRKVDRKRAKIQRSAEEVDETASQAFKDIGETASQPETDSQGSSQGSSQFHALGSPVRERNVQLGSKVIDESLNMRKTRSKS